MAALSVRERTNMIDMSDNRPSQTSRENTRINAKLSKSITDSPADGSQIKGAKVTRHPDDTKNLSEEYIRYIQAPDENRIRAMNSSRYRKDFNQAGVVCQRSNDYEDVRVISEPMRCYVPERSQMVRLQITDNHYNRRNKTCELRHSGHQCPEIIRICGKNLASDKQEKYSPPKLCRRPIRRPRDQSNGDEEVWVAGHAALHRHIERCRREPGAMFYDDTLYMKPGGLFPLLVAEMDTSLNRRQKEIVLARDRWKNAFEMVITLLRVISRRKVSHTTIDKQLDINEAKRLPKISTLAGIVNMTSKWVGKAKKKVREKKRREARARNFLGYKMRKISRTPFLCTIKESAEEEDQASESSADETEYPGIDVIRVIGDSTPSDTLIRLLHADGTDGGKWVAETNEEFFKSL